MREKRYRLEALVRLSGRAEDCAARQLGAATATAVRLEREAAAAGARARIIERRRDAAPLAATGSSASGAARAGEAASHLARVAVAASAITRAAVEDHRRARRTVGMMRVALEAAARDADAHRRQRSAALERMRRAEERRRERLAAECALDAWAHARWTDER